MQPAKQTRFNRNCFCSSGVRSSSSFWMESIHFMQKSAFLLMLGMFSTAAKAAARASGSGT